MRVTGFAHSGSARHALRPHGRFALRVECVGLDHDPWWDLWAKRRLLAVFGAHRATVQEYEAQYQADAAAYRQTVLNSFKEVEDDLAAGRRLAEQIQRQQLALTAPQ